MSRASLGGIVGICVAAVAGGLWWSASFDSAPTQASSGSASAGTASGSSASDGNSTADASAPPVTDDRLQNITFDTLKFDMATKETPFVREMLGPKIEELVGKRVRVRGYIFPTYKQTLTEMVLTRDNQECCFGPGAWVFDCAVVEMQPGKTAQYTTRPVTVEGRLTIRPLEDSTGVTRAVYHIEGESVQ